MSRFPVMGFWLSYTCIINNAVHEFLYKPLLSRQVTKGKLYKHYLLY